MHRRWTRLVLVGSILAGSIRLFGGMVEADAARRSCAHAGKVYYDGSVSCQSGAAYQCDDGVWRDLERAC